MSDWRKLETELLDCFRRLGFRPKMRAEWPNKTENNGDWFLEPTKREVNVSEVARQLALYVQEGKP